jgi:plasmid stabilization system protein ParE
MHSIKYSKQAQADLESAVSHIADESVVNALSYLIRYEEKINLLRLNPYMGVECKNKLIKRECRVLVHESHIIIYKVDADINEIFIIKIYHGAVDYVSKFDRHKDDKNF